MLFFRIPSHNWATYILVYKGNYILHSRTFSISEFNIFFYFMKLVPRKSGIPG
uniref:Uncharacterized protein n=1 Tax=Anguilla anguilla TaxID=7936 RepID=A0A0E9PFH5_ANGAN